MEQNSASPYDNSENVRIMRQVGYGIFIVAFALYIFAQFSGKLSRNDDAIPVFFLNYILSVIYFIAILWQRWNTGKYYAESWSLGLSIFLVSAFTLNVSLPVFAPFPWWLNVITLMIPISLLGYNYRNKLPIWGQIVLSTLMGISAVTTAYFTLFIGPLNFYAIPLALFLGFSLHATVPFQIFITLCVYLYRMRQTPYARIAAWSGALLPLLILGLYLNRWHNIQQVLAQAKSEYFLYYKNDYPLWFTISQKLPNDPLTDMMLRGIISGQHAKWSSNIMDFPNSGNNQFHHPLLVAAHALYGELGFDEETSRKLLETHYDARHQTERRLWRGGDLTTKNVLTNIEVFPKYRFAYTEKTLTIHNDPNRSSDAGWYDQDLQEAVYTFHVPEGSVVSSLSLWVEGKERKSRLTTRKKADSAYVEIVGVQRRDPSLLHWQEGNRVTVTVFPCTAKEDRIFKIGVTSPLIVKNEEWTLPNIWFEGPETEGTTESIQLKIEGKNGENIDVRRGFKASVSGNYTYEGSYRPYWEVKGKAEKLIPYAFSFGGNTYTLGDYKANYQSFTPQNIVLDVTAEWDYKEWQAILEMTKGKQLYAFAPKALTIDRAQEKATFVALRQNRFSLLPFYDIADIENTLIITKTGHKSPMLSDLKESDFANKMTNFLKNNPQKIHVYNFGEELTPFWKSLKEFRMIDYTEGDLPTLEKYMIAKQFPTNQEDENKIDFAQAGFSIQKTQGNITSTAPDHIFRLFAYNELLREIGADFYDREKLEEKWLRKAEEAYVATPVSSLIVLETDEDYDRMGIKENKNTVGNAQISEQKVGIPKTNVTFPGVGGATPEPHEWALIIVMFLGVIWQWIAAKKR